MRPDHFVAVPGAELAVDRRGFGATRLLQAGPCDAVADLLALPSAWGELDLPLLQRRCALMARRIPGAVALTLPGLAHLPSLEAPARFNAALHRLGPLAAPPHAC